MDGRARQRQQLRYLPAVKRKFQNSLILDHLADASTPRLHERRIRLNLYLLRDLAYFKRRVDHCICVDLQNDSTLYKCSKPGQSCFQAIGPDQQIR